MTKKRAQRTRANSHYIPPRLIAGGYHTRHLGLCEGRGFMGEPAGHWKAWANSSMLDRTPTTRNISGLCGSVSTCCNAAAGFLWPHQNCKKWANLVGRT
uniref:Uncharacterized protein n=1 Tax=Romanomermis culicivorax TaxID=13658 RepID=A0A915KLV5_ROMCU